LISSEDAAGLKLTWGNSDAVIHLVTMIGERKNIGKVLGEGVRTAARQIGANAEEFAVHVKGLELPLHDPRCYASLALGYATANRGACHLEAYSHIIERNVQMPELGYEKPLDPHSSEGKGRLVAEMQNLMCMFDSLPICKFVLWGGVRIRDLIVWLNAITGWNVTVKELLKAGERIFNLERLYNVSCGISRKDDTLPARILAHKREDRSEADILPHLDKMLNEYYSYRGWSEDGIPTQEKLKELGLPINFPQSLTRHQQNQQG
jgi:aldehyde:ferredoxin oxidoreductase